MNATVTDYHNHINMTASALNRVHKLMQMPMNAQAKGLRVYIVGGKCAGFQYGFALDKAPHEDDLEQGYTLSLQTPEPVNVQIKLWIDAMSIQYLHGAEIDYEESLLGSRFVVKNPHAKTTCGCGSSFSID